MPLESALDFNAYVDTTTGHGVTATFFDVTALWDTLPLIDTLADIDEGLSISVDTIIDQEYFNIEGGTVPVAGYQPRAILKFSNDFSISQNNKLIVDAITTDQGSVLKPETTFLIKVVEPDNTGLVSVVLEEQ